MSIASYLGISSAVVIICLVLNNLVWSVASALLAKSWRGRNAWNWFFLSCFYGPVATLFLACSKVLDREHLETDTLAQTLWACLIIPLVIAAIFIGIAISD